MNTATRWHAASYVGDALTAASLAYILLHLDPSALNALPGLLVGLGVSLFIAHLVHQIVTLRGAK
jgi:uncharacterized membrane protein